ncbi:hypothetical protein MMC20_005552 [Loxospora ochrophaea]|nr:hypothetical protein [Loxospora ochrophaea]
MTKSKGRAPKATTVPQKHLLSRISFLYQAATYLSSVDLASNKETKSELVRSTATTGLPNDLGDTSHLSQHPEDHGIVARPAVKGAADENRSTKPVPGRSVMERQLISQLRGVSLKAQIRLPTSIKHSICKRCDTILVPGSTSSMRIENNSRNGKKAHADVLVLACLSCDTEKRFSVGAKRQKKRDERTSNLRTDSPPAGMPL